jgi:hypothetical protein
VTSSEDKASMTRESTAEILSQVLTIASEGGRESERTTNPPATAASAHCDDNPFDVIIEAIETISSKHKLQAAARKDLKVLVVYTGAAKRIEKEKEQNNRLKMEVSDLRQILKADLQGMYNALAHKLEELKSSHKEALEKVDLVLKASEASTGMAKELEGKVGKVAEAADKIEICTTSYRDALVTNIPAVIRRSTNPKVLNDIKWRAKQVLIKVFDAKGENTLKKSIEEILKEANVIIKGITDKGKPEDA